MGPRFIDRGNVVSPCGSTVPAKASMGPRFIDRGNVALPRLLRRVSQLQWGRGSLTAEMISGMVFHGEYRCASMGPRFIDRGNTADRAKELLRDAASMGPRFIDRGNQWHTLSAKNFSRASMGPRFIDRGNITTRWWMR